MDIDSTPTDPFTDDNDDWNPDDDPVVHSCDVVLNNDCTDFWILQSTQRPRYIPYKFETLRDVKIKPMNKILEFNFDTRSQTAGLFQTRHLEASDPRNTAISTIRSQVAIQQTTTCIGYLTEPDLFQSSRSQRHQFTITPISTILQLFSDNPRFDEDPASLAPDGSTIPTIGAPPLTALQRAGTAPPSATQLSANQPLRAGKRQFFHIKASEDSEPWLNYALYSQKMSRQVPDARSRLSPKSMEAIPSNTSSSAEYLQLAYPVVAGRFSQSSFRRLITPKMSANDQHQLMHARHEGKDSQNFLKDTSQLIQFIETKRTGQFILDEITHTEMASLPLKEAVLLLLRRGHILTYEQIKDTLVQYGGYDIDESVQSGMINTLGQHPGSNFAPPKSKGIMSNVGRSSFKIITKKDLLDCLTLVGILVQGWWVEKEMTTVRTIVQAVRLLLLVELSKNNVVKLNQIPQIALLNQKIARSLLSLYTRPVDSDDLMMDIPPIFAPRTNNMDEVMSDASQMLGETSVTFIHPPNYRFINAHPQLVEEHRGINEGILTYSTQIFAQYAFKPPKVKR
ncbi:putative Sin-like protein conserved region [Blattamonas nauphoetae]|uniref:Sin-like protein conserved region n=1 Tax=Blattamonas nauphoetae TaxID=2049346 RepID=A0ABQ9YK70_9EUKA|nr:putative Sin-like protein conserved region [Blattamonas nauphoetae]